jgi:hypothetical protein
VTTHATHFSHYLTRTLFQNPSKLPIWQHAGRGTNVADVRQTFYNVNNLYDLFTNVAGDTILIFSFKEINLCTKI